MPIDHDDDGITIPCPAKLNLTLAVGPPRTDGLHPIASVMTPIHLHDRVTLTKLPQGPSRFERAVAPGCPRPFALDWPIEKDLACRAHALLEQQTAQALPVACHISKMIPTGAGLGGGSSDAAGVLVGLRALFRLQVSDQQLAQWGATLGADVPFAIHAITHPSQAALVTGIGEIVQPIAPAPPANAVLLLPDGACPTAQVYRAFDEGTQSPRPGQELGLLAQQWQSLSHMPQPMNDLTPAAVAVCPAIASAITTLSSLGHNAHLTGSGSALFVLTDSPEHAGHIAAQAHAAGLAAFAAISPPDAK